MNLWVFGDSNSLAFNLNLSDLSWPQIVSNQIHAKLINRAKPAVDNFFIYQSWLQDHKNISCHDIVVIGWSHFSRKMFVKDTLKSAQNSALSCSMIHEDHGKLFIRSQGIETDELRKSKKIDQNATGIRYFDTWFLDYYDEYEQKINFQSYIDSVHFKNPNAVHFYFSKASIKDINILDVDPLCILDFMIDNEMYLSETDYHANPKGHLSWADLILEKIHALPNIV